MKRVLFSTIAVLVTAGAGFTYYKQATTAESMTSAGKAFVETLNSEQKALTVLDYGSPKRFEWHFIPKDERKGFQVKQMSQQQRKAAHNLLRNALSEVGYGKTTKIMELEKLLHELEAGKGRNIRDPERYYFTLFGEPGKDDRWGLSVEGHHLSLNFVVDDDRVASTTPQFFGANPAIVKTENSSGIAVGTRVLAKEEALAFDLVNSLSDEQKKAAVIAEKAPSEIRDAGSAQPPSAAPEGIALSSLSGEQKRTLRQLVDAYCESMPESVAEQRMNAIRDAGTENVHFAWAGALEPGIGHYYRVQGPTFLIEFVNTQPDAAGNPANHIHAVWRDMHGDFAVPSGK